MEGVNLLCETPNCSKRAVAFGIKEAVKVKSCEEHLASLLSKKLQICDITGYTFISNLHDAADFEERKTLVDKGLGNLAALEANCDIELATALQAIESVENSVRQAVEQRFEEIKVEVTEACKQVKHQITELQRNLEQFLISKEMQLSPSAKVVCGKLSIIPLFLRFGISDISSRISAELSTNWGISTADIHSTLKCLDATQKKATVDSALAEAAEYAKKGIHNALCYVDLLTGEEEFDKPQVKMLAEVLKFERTRVEGNLKWLQHAWDLRQRFDFAEGNTVKVGQQLAVLLYRQLGQFATSERILRLCHELTHMENPLSAASMSLCVEVCSVYAASAQCEQTEELGLWTLQTFAGAGLPTEHYWTVLLHLTDSMRLRGKDMDALAVLEQWRELKAENKLSEMLRLLVHGSEAFESGDTEEAGRSFVRARRIGTSHFPASIFTALAFFLLAQVTAGTEREQLHLHARSIYETTAPKTCYAAVNLTSMGVALAQKEQYGAAEECYQQAKAIYELAAPKSVYAAVNLCSMATVLEQKARWDEAADCRQQAWVIYESAAPRSIGAANNLTKMGISFEKRERWAEAEECYRKALAINEAIDPKSISAAENLAQMGAFLEKRDQLDKAIACRQQAWTIYPQSVEAAANLTQMANLFEKKERWSDAVECYRQARAIFEVVAPKSVDAAVNIANMGVLLYSQGQWNDAEECYQQAKLIYEAAAPKSASAATNFRNMGTLFDKREQLDAAEQCFRQAQSIYEATAPKSIAAGNNLRSIATLLKKRERLEEAAESYQQAKAIFEVVAPKSTEAAINLANMAVLFETQKKWNEAEEYYRQAKATHEAAASKSIDAAINLTNMGLFFYEKKRWSEAEECFLQALAMYEVAGPKSASAATNLYYLGLVCKAMGQNARAIEYLYKAVAIYAEKGNETMKSNAEVQIAQLISL